MHRLSYSFGLTLPLFLATQWLQAATPMTFELRDPKTKEVYYTGQETKNQNGPSVRRETVFFNPSKQVVQKENLEIDAASFETKKFLSSNSLTGEETAVASTDAGLTVSYKAGRDGKNQTSVIKGGKEVLLPNVASDLITQNWDILLAGKTVKFDLIIPSRLETIPFQLVKRELTTVDGEAREVFALMPQNILIRMLAPHLEFQFSQDKKIRQATFPSSLPIQGAKDRMVEMVIKG